MAAVHDDEASSHGQRQSELTNEHPMRRDKPIGKLSRETLQRAWPAAALLSAVALAGAWFLVSTIPHRIVLASGLQDGLYHQYAQRYKEILAREGVTVEERMTGGAEDNEQFLHNPKSGVDVAFMHGGIVRPQERGNLTMLMALYYEPLWIFYRGPATLTQLDELRGKQVAIGSPGSGIRAFVEPLLAANDITYSNTRLSPLVNLEALHALQRGEIDAALFIGQVQFPAVWEALHDPSLKLMSLERADAYPRRFPYITKLTLPGGDRRLCPSYTGPGGQAHRHQGHARGARRPVAGDHQPAAGRSPRIALPAGIFRRRTASSPTPRLSTCPYPPTPAATCASARASCTATSLSSSRPISSA